MNFFSKLFKKKHTKIDIFAPLSGTIIELEKVPDEVFSKKIVGDGVAIKPSGNQLVAPFSGTIGKIFKTLHAFSIKSDENIELFVHFGIDTVKLKGKGFNRLIKKKNRVKVGEPIIGLDLLFLKKNAVSTITPIIISNMEEIHKIKKFSGKIIAGKTKIMTITK
ncbi:PTS glucose transporter subunit IIA [Buchnera aphidicola]|uniref:PTS glucose transporter subunit IIA n=1 Tax=Buchnera aphidicola TaxID=9 RepID=UPI0031B84F9C